MNKIKKRVLSILTIGAMITTPAIGLTANAWWDSYVEHSNVTPYSISCSANDNLRILKQQYPSGTYWNTNRYSPCVHTGYLSETCLSFTTSDLLLPNFAIMANPPITNQNTNPNTFYQCYGFAFQLASSLFGTKSFVQLYYNQLCAISSNGLYEPRVGDHVRINNQSHSIFITGVNASTGYVTYADCNANNNGCKIQWDQTKTIASLQQASTLYVFRPMMAGDLDNNTVINEADYSILQDIINGTKPVYEQYVNGQFRFAAADINGNRVIDQDDAVLLRNVLNHQMPNTMPYLGDSISVWVE